MEGENRAAVSFRVYDQNNYWTDPAMADFGSSTKAVLDLSNLVSDKGRKLDPSHIYIAGFWSLGNAPFRISKIYLSDTPDGESAIEEIYVSPEPKLVDVYNIYGVKLKSQVPPEESTQGLQRGIYIIGGKKVAITQ